MSLFTLIFVLILVGAVLWLINRYVPMESTIKRILNYAVIIFLVLYLLSELGFLAWLKSIQI